MQLNDKVVVISGGASGLGKATAKFMVQKYGAKVALFDVNETAGAAVEKELGKENAIFCLVDVTHEASIDNAIAAVMNKFGAIHVNINAAGIPMPCRILNKEGRATQLEKYAEVTNVNLNGVYNMMAKCAEKIAKNSPDPDGERGVIVNVSSGAAFEGQIGQCAYSGSKSGVNGMNIPAARELGGLGIRVNSIAPGLFGTPMIKSFDQKVQQKLIQTCEAPKRMGDMNEFASACVFLVENGYMNGRVIRLDAATVLGAQ